MCVYWRQLDRDDENEGGLCRRFPPLLIGELLPHDPEIPSAPIGARALPAFPVVQPDCWCGEFSGTAPGGRLLQ